MNIVPVMITCPGREALREQTLQSWRATDMGVEPLIQMDTNQHERRQERQEHNSLSALKLALAWLNEKHWAGMPGEPAGSDACATEFILFMEDDIIFNRHLRHNLEHWGPIHRGGNGCFFASLYDCTIRELESHPEEHYFIADPAAVYGSQCYLVSAPLARHLVEEWWEVPGMQDIKMSRLAARRCPLYYHVPSLVQHVGVQSAWGGRFHNTKAFDAEFKAGA